jgi:hypothetical protein
MDIKKIKAKLPAGFADEVEGFDDQRLRDVIIESEAALAEIDREMESDEKLQATKELLRDCMAAYKEAKKMQRAKIAYVLHLLEERGKL